MIQYISGLCEGCIDYLERLPKELIVMILRRCDTPSIAHMSTLNSRFDQALCDNNSDLFVWTELSPQSLVRYIAHLQHLAMRFRTEISNHPKWKPNKWSLTGLYLIIWWFWDTLSNSLLYIWTMYDPCIPPCQTTNETSRFKLLDWNYNDSCNVPIISCQ